MKNLARLTKHFVSYLKRNFWLFGYFIVKPLNELKKLDVSEDNLGEFTKSPIIITAIF